MISETFHSGLQIHQSGVIGTPDHEFAKFDTRNLLNAEVSDLVHITLQCDIKSLTQAIISVDKSHTDVAAPTKICWAFYVRMLLMQGR